MGEEKKEKWKESVRLRNMGRGVRRRKRIWGWERERNRMRREISWSGGVKRRTTGPTSSLSPLILVPQVRPWWWSRSWRTWRWLSQSGPPFSVRCQWPSAGPQCGPWMARTCRLGRGSALRAAARCTGSPWKRPAGTWAEWWGSPWARPRAAPRSVWRAATRSLSPTPSFFFIMGNLQFSAVEVVVIIVLKATTNNFIHFWPSFIYFTLVLSFFFFDCIKNFHGKKSVIWNLNGLTIPFKLGQCSSTFEVSRATSWSTKILKKMAHFLSCLVIKLLNCLTN